MDRVCTSQWLFTDGDSYYMGTGTGTSLSCTWCSALILCSLHLPISEHSMENGKAWD